MQPSQYGAPMYGGAGAPQPYASPYGAAAAAAPMPPQQPQQQMQPQQMQMPMNNGAAPAAAGGGGAGGATSLHIANVAPTWNEAFLTPFFASFPGFQRVRTLRDKSTGGPATYAFADFADSYGATQALQVLNGQPVGGTGQTFRLAWAQSGPPQRGGGGGYAQAAQAPQPQSYGAPPSQPSGYYGQQSYGQPPQQAAAPPTDMSSGYGQAAIGPYGQQPDMSAYGGGYDPSGGYGQGSTPQYGQAAGSQAPGAYGQGGYGQAATAYGYGGDQQSAYGAAPPQQAPQQPLQMGGGPGPSGGQTEDLRSLFIRDLPFEASEADLFNLFASRYRSVAQANIIKDKSTGRSKGYGFVRFRDHGEAQRAIDEMNGTPFMGRSIGVSDAITRPGGGGAAPSASSSVVGVLGPEYAPALEQLAATPLAPPPSPEEGNTTVFVGGLDPRTTEAELRFLFQGFGPISHVSVPPGKNCGFLEFQRASQAEYAIRSMSGYRIGDASIRPTWGKPNAPKRQSQMPSAHAVQQIPPTAYQQPVAARPAGYSAAPARGPAALPRPVAQSGPRGAPRPARGAGPPRSAAPPLIPPRGVLSQGGPRMARPMVPRGGPVPRPIMPHAAMGMRSGPRGRPDAFAGAKRGRVDTEGAGAAPKMRATANADNGIPGRPYDVAAANKRHGAVFNPSTVHGVTGVAYPMAAMPRR